MSKSGPLFDAEIVQRVRWLSAMGESDRALAEVLDCTPIVVYLIRTRRTRKDVTVPIKEVRA